MSITNINSQINDASPNTPKSNTNETNTSNTSHEELTDILKSSINFYFSKENLLKDDFLVSKMNSEMYVPIPILLELEKIKSITTDQKFLLKILKGTSSVIVDETETKVKPNITLQRNTLVLREIPNDVTEQEIRDLFDENCPPLVSIRSDIGNTWFLVFQSEPEALNMLSYIRGKAIRGQHIPARIKSETILRGTYISKTSSSTPPLLNNQSPYPPMLPMAYPPIPQPYPYPYPYYPPNPSYSSEMYPEPYYHPPMYQDPSYIDYANSKFNHNQYRPPKPYRKYQPNGQSETQFSPQSNNRHYSKNNSNSNNAQNGYNERRPRDDKNYRRNGNRQSDTTRSYSNNNGNYGHPRHKKEIVSLQPQPRPSITPESFPPLSSTIEKATSAKNTHNNFALSMSQVVKNLKQSESSPASFKREYSMSNKLPNVNSKIETNKPLLHQPADSTNLQPDINNLNQLNGQVEKLTINPSTQSSSYAAILKQKALERAQSEVTSTQAKNQTATK